MKQKEPTKKELMQRNFNPGDEIAFSYPWGSGRQRRYSKIISKTDIGYIVLVNVGKGDKEYLIEFKYVLNSKDEILKQLQEIAKQKAELRAASGTNKFYNFTNKKSELALKRFVPKNKNED